CTRRSPKHWLNKSPNGGNSAAIRGFYPCFLRRVSDSPRCITRCNTSASSSANRTDPNRRGRGISTVKSRPIFPSSINNTRSAIATASLTSCVTNSTVKPCSCQSDTIKSCISSRVKASSAPSGSSSNNKPGR
ncbi:aminopeptidase N, partial [Escherichia coli EC1736]